MASPEIMKFSVLRIRALPLVEGRPGSSGLVILQDALRYYTDEFRVEVGSVVTMSYNKDIELRLPIQVRDMAGIVEGLDVGGRNGDSFRTIWGNPPKLGA